MALQAPLDLEAALRQRDQELQGQRELGRARRRDQYQNRSQNQHRRRRPSQPHQLHRRRCHRGEQIHDRCGKNLCPRKGRHRHDQAGNNVCETGPENATYQEKTIVIKMKIRQIFMVGCPLEKNVRYHNCGVAIFRGPSGRRGCAAARASRICRDSSSRLARALSRAPFQKSTFRLSSFGHGTISETVH